MPFGGLYGYFSGIPKYLLSFFGVADIQGDIVTFHLFEARGFNLLVPFLDLIGSNGAIWLLIVICSVFLFVFGVLGLFSLIYASFSDAKHIFISQIIKTVIPWLLVFFMVLEWILLGIAFATTVPSTNVVPNAIGLTMSIISMVLIIAAIYRDYIFRGKDASQSIKNEVSR